MGVLSDLLGSIGNAVQEHAPVLMEAFGRDQLLRVLLLACLSSKQNMPLETADSLPCHVGESCIQYP